MPKYIFTAAAALLLVDWLALPAYAAPAFCTGTTTTLASGGFVPGSSLLTGTASNGNCVEASDKIFGAFSVSGAISGAGGAGFLFTMPAGPADVTMGFTGLVGPSTTGSINYSVAVDPLKSNGALIDDLEKDFTFNAITSGVGASATLTGLANGIAFDCGRTVPAGGTGGAPVACPETHVFSTPIAQMTVNETITTSANANVTGLTDTISQIGVPEPTSMALLAGSLLMLGFVRHRRRS